MKNSWKYLKMEIWCCGFLRIQKLKKKILFPWIGPFKVKKAFNNNNIQLSTLNDENVALVNANKLKAYQNPIIIVVVIIIITKDINEILQKELVKEKKFGGRWRQLGNLYGCLNPNRCERNKWHNKNYGNKIFTLVQKNLIMDNKEWKSATTIHYDTIIKAIPNTKIIMPLKPLWPPTLYLTHQEKNNIRCT